jgi:hypothetical protein
MTKGAAGTGKRRVTRKAAKKASLTKAAAHILGAAKGPRTVSHRRIKSAVEKVLRERSLADA